MRNIHLWIKMEVRVRKSKHPSAGYRAYMHVSFSQVKKMKSRRKEKVFNKLEIGLN